MLGTFCVNVCVSVCLHVSMCSVCVPGAHKGHERALDPLKQELNKV